MFIMTACAALFAYLGYKTEIAAFTYISGVLIFMLTAIQF